MAHDDMPVIMYKILACLYDCMKRGVDQQRSMLSHDGSMLSIPYRHWARIVAELASRGYVTGFTVTKDIAGGLIVDIRDPEITFEGSSSYRRTPQCAGRLSSSRTRRTPSRSCNRKRGPSEESLAFLKRTLVW